MCFPSYKEYLLREKRRLEEDKQEILERINALQLGGASEEATKIEGDIYDEILVKLSVLQRELQNLEVDDEFG